jgi:hypothetical protein
MCLISAFVSFDFNIISTVLMAIDEKKILRVFDRKKKLQNYTYSLESPIKKKIYEY